MLEFQEKRKIRRFIYSKFTLVILTIFVLFLLNAVWKVYKKKNYTYDNLYKVSTNLNNLRDREKMLSSEIERLKTEMGQEEEIREKFGLVKPGEEVIIIVDKDDALSSNGIITKASFWKRFLNLFK